MKLFLKKKLRSLLREFSYYSSFSPIRPSNVFLDITDRCQLRCTTCSKWTTPDKMKAEELTTNEWKDTLIKLKDWLGSYSVVFCGGEPFLREDLLELIDFAARNEIYSSVITNGYGIDRLAEEIIHSQLSSLHVSLNGITSDIHDVTRGIPGSFEKTMKTILKINALRTERNTGTKLWLNVSTILMPYNSRELIPLVEWVKKQHLDSINFQMLEDKISFHPFSKVTSIQHTDGYSMHEPISHQWKDSRASLIHLIDKLIRKKQAGFPVSNSEAQLRAMKLYIQNPGDILPIKCRVGISNFSIDAYGNVRLCFNMAPIGSIQRYDPKQLWNSGKARLQRAEIRNCKMFCRLLSCNFKP